MNYQVSYFKRPKIPTMPRANPQKKFLLILPKLPVHPNKRRKFNPPTPPETNRLERWNYHLPQPINLMPISREDYLEDDPFNDDCDSDEAVCATLDNIPNRQNSPEYVEAQSESDCMNSWQSDSGEDEASDFEDEAESETYEEDVYVPCCPPENIEKKRGKKRKRETKIKRDQYMRFDRTTHRSKQNTVWLCYHNSKRGTYLASHENQLIACLLADKKAEGWETKFNRHKTSMIDVSKFCFHDFGSKMKLVMTNEWWNADVNLWGRTLFLWKRLSFVDYIPETAILVGYSIKRNGQSTTKAIKLSGARPRKRKNWCDHHHHVAPFRDFKDASNHVLPEEAMKEILGRNFDGISLYFISMTKRALKESIQTNRDSSKILKDALRRKLNAQEDLERRKAN